MYSNYIICAHFVNANCACRSLYIVFHFRLSKEVSGLEKNFVYDITGESTFEDVISSVSSAMNKEKDLSVVMSANANTDVADEETMLEEELR
jgi:hypothetical protein